MKDSKISWTHNTWNPWVGCDKVAPECQHCYIDRTIRKQTDWQTYEKREPWGQVYLTKTWYDPYDWQSEMQPHQYQRVFTCSLSDFFHAKVDDRRMMPLIHKSQRTWYWAQPEWQLMADRRAGGNLWRDCAWQVIRDTPNCVYLILTKRPERILAHLPKDWGKGYPNVWLGTSVGCNATLSKLDSLRKVPVHPKAVRFVSCEPLLEDISSSISLDGIGWVIIGGESGDNPEYLWTPDNWKSDLRIIKPGRRTMNLDWAYSLMLRAKRSNLPVWFKQVTASREGQGATILTGSLLQEVPAAPKGEWICVRSDTRFTATAARIQQ